jgi:hypothetical protein
METRELKLKEFYKLYTEIMTIRSESMAGTITKTNKTLNLFEEVKDLIVEKEILDNMKLLKNSTIIENWGNEQISSLFEKPKNYFGIDWANGNDITMSQ